MRDVHQLVEDADGIHVIVRTTGSMDNARQLLRDYGAYSVAPS